MSEKRGSEYHSDSENDRNKTPEKKKPKIFKNYERKLRREWLENEKYASWIEVSKKNESKAFCKVCSCEIAGSVVHLERHMKTEKHCKNMRSINNSSSIINLLQAGTASVYSRRVAAAELKMCAFVAEHNLPVSILDHLPGMIANVCKDSKICKDIKCARTKGTGVFRSVIGKYYINELIETLKKTKFSLIIDETTDVSTLKQLVLLVRYYDSDAKKTIDKYLTLLEVKDCTAKGIFDSLSQFFQKKEIPFDNLVGFASDNASVMMGSKSGVQCLLKQKVPSLYVQGCVCHSMHLCASKACLELPNELEDLARSTYTYLSNSPKRLNEYKEFQIFTNTDPRKILHISCTRWLSLEQVAKRILDQWPALTLFFTSAALEDNIKSATVILDQLQNPINKMYYAFLAFILPVVNKINLEFQAESFRLHKFRNSISTSVKGILSYFVKREMIKNKELEEIDIKDPSIYLKIEEVYHGTKVEAIYIENESKITYEMLKQFQVQTLNFYVKLTMQMCVRFLSHDTFKTLKLLEAMDPENVAQGKPRSIIPLALKFEHIISEDQHESLNTEWRELTLDDSNDANRFDEKEPEKFWYNVSKEKIGDEIRYPTLSKLMLGLLALPHSSACAERIFSLLNNIKTKNRSSLNTDTVNALLYSKSLLKNTNCTKWAPNEELITMMKKENLYKEVTDQQDATF